MIQVPKFLIALALVGLVDAISYMVVAPSIVFYVLEHGGTREQYGIILSAFSFSSFCAKPFVGWWSDGHGFRVPYMICLAISAVGGLVYLLASAFYGTTAVAMIFAARLLGGVGAASAALGFAYLAKAVPHDEQTKTSSLLSMTRIVGMTTGPALNVLLAEIDTTWFGLRIDSLNSVGAVLVATNLLALSSVYALLDEPEADHTAPKKPKHEEQQSTGNGFWDLVKSLMRLEILVPIFTILSFNANFQMIETGLAPSASHAMGWTPVGVSGIMGGVSIVIFVNMMIVFSLSARKVKDEFLLMFGSVVGGVGYSMVWYLWQWNAQPWQFVLPVVVGTTAFPFLAAPTRSVFTKAVDRIELLRDRQGSMQALLSMFASVAGFVTPGLVATYVLRDPDEVEQDGPHARELTPYALVAPGMTVLVFFGVIAVYIKSRRQEASDEETNENGSEPSESTSLLQDEPPSVQRRTQSLAGPRSICKKHFTCQTEVHRRHSVHVMGMVQLSTLDEMKMHKDFKEIGDNDGAIGAEDENNKTINV